MDVSLEHAKDGAWEVEARAERELGEGVIDEAGWHRLVAEALVPGYLAADTPWGQSGKSGDYAAWERARRHLSSAFDGDGTFLDVGCANGFLLECLVQWLAERSITLEPYGLDIAPELVDLARHRLPEWTERFAVGDGLTWNPPMRFDYVRTGLEYVPKRRQRDLVQRLMDSVVAPSGRLIIGCYNEEVDVLREGPTVVQRLEDWGFARSGGTDIPHRDPRLRYRSTWIDGPERPPRKDSA